ncbi:MAG: phosphate propanoyltransferase [Pseudomonadota bacterium]
MTATSTSPSMQIPVAVSARHVHLTQATIEQLFGADYRLHGLRSLSQPHEFAADDTVTIVGPSGSITHVRVLGPPRHEDQVEISRSDAVHLGIPALVRISGELRDTPGATLIGARGELQLTHGVIIAHRHIHMNPADALRFGLRDRDVVAVAINSNDRDLVFGDVSVRVSRDFVTELHLDTDEANAADIAPGTTATLLPAGLPTAG